MLVIPDLVTPTERADLTAALEAAAWGDGARTAGWQAAAVKQNAQLSEDDPLAERLGDLVLGALERSKLFIAAALPLRIYPPMFNRYAGGQSFGDHTDTAIRQIPGAFGRVRADLSATLFLSDPAAYSGGELIVYGASGARSAKLSAGSLVLYPAGAVHRVEPVTAGVRLAAIMWVQSMVRDAGQRDVLYDLDSAIQHLAAPAAGHPALVQLTGVYHNLLRRWADC